MSGNRPFLLLAKREILWDTCRIETKRRRRHNGKMASRVPWRSGEVTLIALVDDDADFTHLVSELLEDRGWSTISCHNEADAMRCVDHNHPDLIILDIRLDHRASGWHILESLQANPQTRSIPVIVCSAALDDLRRQEEWLRERHILTLPKPFDIDDLLTLVERSLGGTGDPKGGVDPHHDRDGHRCGSS